MYTRFAFHAEADPSRVALRYANRHLDYGSFRTSVECLAAELIERGVTRGTRVAISMERSVASLRAILAVIAAGGAYVPLETDQPVDRAAFILEDSEAALLLTDPARPALEGWPADRTLVVDEETGRDPGGTPLPDLGPDDLMYVIYTSGSTGRPKGVMVRHGNVLWLIDATAGLVDLTGDSVFLASTSYSFDISVFEIFGPLTKGGTVVLAGETERRDPQAFAELARRCDVDFLQATPSTWQVLVDSGAWFPKATKLTVGETLPGELAARMAAMGPTWNLYGPTEATVYATARSVSPGVESDPSVGVPLRGATITLRDEHGVVLESGEVGEAYIGGFGVAAGYLNRPEADARHFLTDPDTGELVYRTGDLMRRSADGDHVFVGRVDRQTKIRGHRVEPEETESVLRSLPGVSAAAVTVHGEAGERYMVAHVAHEEGTEADKEAVRSGLAERLPHYMVPAFVRFADELPTNASGKVDRSALVDLRSSITPLDGEGGGWRTIARDFEDLLGIDGVGEEDDFLTLGGHSLLAMRLLSRLRKRHGGTAIDYPALISNATPIGLSRLIERVGSEETAEFPRPGNGDRLGPMPLTVNQEQLWFIERMVPGNLAYNSQAALRVRGELSVPALERALRRMVERHEIFRTTFRDAHGSPYQLVGSPWKVEVPILDLGDLPEEERDGRLIEWLNGDLVTAPFDLAELPLVRWRVARLAPDDHVFVTVEHHFVHDGWSWAVFWRDLFTLYEEEVGSAPRSSNRPSLQYGDFARWQRALLELGFFEPQLDYWESRLRGVPEVLRWPHEYERPPLPTFKGERPRVAISDRLYGRLRDRARQDGTSLFALMLTTFCVMVAERTGENDIVVGSAMANRRYSEFDDTIGMFVNTVPLRNRVRRDTGFLDLVREAGVRVAEGIQNQEVPLELIVRRMAPPRDPSHNPLFQLMFSFHDSPVPAPSFAGLTGEIIEVANGSAKVDLNVIVVPHREQRVGKEEAEGASMSLLWEYSQDVFDRTIGEELIGLYVAFLEEVAFGGTEREVVDIVSGALARAENDPSAEFEIRRDWIGEG
ncbi:amino acid adenylation domain-containing protein [Nocardiopsis alba]|uniref:amino acid adenylation domain-containing protein n=1 Tax=Nocardiopsis alba TaxID=53437 RepID=UPI0033F8C3FF